MPANYRLTWNPEPKDLRDRPFNAPLSAPELPTSVDLRSKVVEVLDQGPTGACVAHATAQALRVAQYVRTGKVPPLPSRRWIYEAARILDRDGDVNVGDSGTYVRSAMKVCTDLGFCTEQDFPFTYDPVQINQRPPYHAYRAAYDSTRLSGYYRLAIDSPSEDLIKTALASGMPVAFGIYLDASFHLINSFKPWEASGSITGGHAMCIVGYDDDGVLVCNSWSSAWGVGGFCKIGWKTITGGIANDFWAARLSGEAA